MTMTNAPSPSARAPADPLSGARAHENAAHGLLVLGTLSLLMGFASISTDLYLPAMPAMAVALRAGTGTVEYTISGYLIGFSLGQLVWGPVGDRYGRRLPVAIGLVLFVIGSAGCAMSTSVAALIAWRVIQAIGACASVVLARAMVRDLYQGDRAAQMMSTLMTVMAIAPLVGPLVGGQIMVLGSWRAIFWALVAIGLATLGALLTLPETLPADRRNTEPLATAFAQYTLLLGDRRLLGYAGAGGFLYAGVYAYVAGTPFAYISYYHVPPRWYGLLFALGLVGVMTANMVNARTVRRHGSDRLLRRGCRIAALTGIVLAIDARTGLGGLAGLAGLVVPLVLFIASTGLIAANSIAGALALFPDRSGAVSALIGAFQYGSGVAGSALVGAFADGTPWPIGWVIALCGLGCAASTLLIPANRRSIASGNPLASER